MVRFRKGIFKNNLRLVILDGNFDFWVENLKGVLKQKYIFREIYEVFQKLVYFGYYGFVIDIVLNIIVKLRIF